MACELERAFLPGNQLRVLRGPFLAEQLGKVHISPTLAVAGRPIVAVRLSVSTIRKRSFGIAHTVADRDSAHRQPMVFAQARQSMVRILESKTRIELVGKNHWSQPIPT
jgi:hypothetical protein